MTSGTSSQGGAGAIVARKERAAGTAYVVINVEQHSADYVGALLDIVEVAAVESGLVAIDAEAIGRDLTEKGRVVLDGILFEFDKATLKAESNTALEAIAQYLKANPTKGFFVVGHTDAVGRFAYNQQLSADRAKAVVEALTTNYGVAAGRLEAHGVGPLVPVFSTVRMPGGSQSAGGTGRTALLIRRRSCAMAARPLVWILLALWAACFFGPRLVLTTVPTGSGFTRGLSRVTTFFGWHSRRVFLRWSSGRSAGRCCPARWLAGLAASRSPLRRCSQLSSSAWSPIRCLSNRCTSLACGCEALGAGSGEAEFRGRRRNAASVPAAHFNL